VGFFEAGVVYEKREREERADFKKTKGVEKKVTGTRKEKERKRKRRKDRKN